MAVDGVSNLQQFVNLAASVSENSTIRAGDDWRGRLEGGAKPAEPYPAHEPGPSAKSVDADSLSDEELMRAAMAMIAV